MTASYVGENIRGISYGVLVSVNGVGDFVSSVAVGLRHYGALTSLDKEEARKLFGADQVEQWRRSYAIRPPLPDASEALNSAADFPYMKLSDSAVPLGECLHDTVQRVIIMGHGNSLRALIKDLEGLSDDAIAELEIPNVVPLVSELDSSLKPTTRYRIEVS